MKAIVLSYDKNRLLADHMIYQYERLWPGHPFVFRVPYQELLPATHPANVEFRRTPVDIKRTVLTLLDDLADDEMVYWCIDDKYPIRLELPPITAIYRWLIEAGAATDYISGVLFCRCRKMLFSEYLTGCTVSDGNSQTYLERSGYEQIWIHQFLRVKVLRHLFRAFPDDIAYPRLMDAYKENVHKPDQQRLYVSEKNLAVFGESTSYGLVTSNCHRSILNSGFAPPHWACEPFGEEVTMGEL